MPEQQAEQIPALMTVREVATYYGFTVGTINNWMSKGYGPKFAKVGGHMKARRTEVEAFLAELFDDQPADADRPRAAAG